MVKQYYLTVGQMPESQSTTMMEELGNAGKQLRAALDHYLSISSRVDDISSREGVLHKIPQHYLHDISTEVKYLSSYRLQLKKVESTVLRVRNRLSQLAPVASLHPEILAHIFDLVAKPCDLRVVDVNAESPSCVLSISELTDDEDAHPGGLEGHCGMTKQLDNFPTHLDRLTRVCSYWRQVAINTPSLWTHVDIIPHKFLHNAFITRAKVYVARAKRLPIQLHIAEVSRFVYNGVTVPRFLSSICGRVESLDITINQDWRQFRSIVFRELFPHLESEPLVLAELKTNFVAAYDRGDEFIDCLDDKNDGLRRLSVLHLRGFFPLWTSVAYHNLVDLRLASQSDELWTPILERELKDILKASPGLRIFHFALHITNRRPDDESVIPIHLEDLEVLNISTYRRSQDPILRPGDVLRLIAPGSKPLRLSIWHKPGDDDFDYQGFSLDELIRFFKRSKVAKLCLKYAYPQLDRLLSHSPNLEDLVFDTCVFGWQGFNLIRGGSPATSRLNSLVLYCCSPGLRQLELLLEGHPSEHLLLSKCSWDYIRNSSEDQNPAWRFLGIIERCPTKLVIQSSDPTLNWSIVD